VTTITGTPPAIAAQLRARRLQLGLSQAEAAERVGWPQPTWARLEAGRHAPTLETLERAAAALGCRVTLEEG
jgi:transcriptional regulator with XRE-family HTH domain